jgi:ferredoxin
MYVFSATGNTLHMAKLIKESSKDREIMIKAISEKDEIIKNETNMPVIGIYFPCYYGSMPNLVKRFVTKLHISPESYIYSVVTAGGNTGYCNKELSTLLEDRGLTLSFGEDIAYSSNYMPGWYYKYIYKSPEKIILNLDKFKMQAQKIAKTILNKEKVEVKGSYVGYKLPKLISQSYLVKDTRPHDREYAISEKCNKCGLCAKVCPVENIEINNKSHIFKHKCQRCLACIQYCPKQAFIINNQPMNKERYVNPFVKVDEIIELHKE